MEDFILVSGTSLVFVTTQLLMQAHRGRISVREAWLDIGAFVFVGVIVTLILAGLGILPNPKPKKVSP